MAVTQESAGALAWEVHERCDAGSLVQSSAWPSLRQIDDDSQRYLTRDSELMLTCEIRVRVAWCCLLQVSCTPKCHASVVT